MLTPMHLRIALAAFLHSFETKQPSIRSISHLLGYRLRRAGSASGLRASEIEAKVLRFDTLYRQLVPNPETPAPPIHALPPR